jgi:hypothetical protein
MQQDALMAARAAAPRSPVRSLARKATGMTTEGTRKTMIAAHDELKAPRPLDDDEKQEVLTAGRRAGSLAAFAELIGMNPKTVWRALYAWNRHRHQTLDTLLYATPLFNRAYDLGYAEARAEAEARQKRLERENAELRRVLKNIRASLGRQPEA